MTDDELRRELEAAKAEITHLRGWKQGAEEGADHMRKEVEYWKTMALRAEADEKRVKELEIIIEGVRQRAKDFNTLADFYGRCHNAITSAALRDYSAAIKSELHRFTRPGTSVPEANSR